MAQLTEAQIVALIQKYWPSDQWANVYRIVMRESGGNTGAANDQAPSRERSYGLMQINTNPDAHGARVTAAQMRDPEQNIKFAAQLYREVGWSPWKTGANNQGTPDDPNWVLRDVPTPFDQGKVQGTSAKVMASPDQSRSMAEPNQPKTMTAVEFEAWLKQKGIKAANALPETTDDKVKRIPAKLGQPTEFQFNDGTSLTAQWDGQNSQWVIKDWGSAGKAETEAKKAETGTVSTPSSNPYIVHPDGSTDPNPNYRPPADQSVSTPTSQPYIAVRQADGTTRWEENKNYVPPAGPDPQDIEYKRLQIEKAKRDLAETSDPQEQRIKALQIQKMEQDLAGDPLSDEYKRLQIQKMQQDMVGVQMQAYQQHEDFIADLQGRIERKEITPQEATQLMDLSRKNLKATLMGTTLWQQETAKREDERAKQTLGRNILNDRLSNSSNLAQNIISSAMGFAGRNMSGAGGIGPINFDPFAMAAQYTNQQGGGQEVADLGRSLVLGATGGGAVTGDPLGNSFGNAVSAAAAPLVAAATTPGTQPPAPFVNRTPGATPSLKLPPMIALNQVGTGGY